MPVPRWHFCTALRCMKQKRKFFMWNDFCEKKWWNILRYNIRLELSLLLYEQCTLNWIFILLVYKIAHESTIHGSDRGDVEYLHQVDKQLGNIVMQDVKGIPHVTNVVGCRVAILSLSFSQLVVNIIEKKPTLFPISERILHIFYHIIIVESLVNSKMNSFVTWSWQ